MTHEEMARLYAEVEKCTAEADEAYAEYQRQVALTGAAHDAYQKKAIAEREARRVWLAAGDEVFAA